VISDPASAPPRPDLGFLRHRTRPKPPAAESAVADFVSGRTAHHPAHHTAEAAPSRPSSSLDLSDAPAPEPAPSAAPPSQRVAPRVHEDTRIAAGERHVLAIKAPTVTLTRVQSGVGQLRIEARCSQEDGDLRLGAVYQLRDGASSTVQQAGGSRFAPSFARPFIVAGRDDEYEVLRLDLRQARSLERLAVYAFSDSRAELTWGGTLVISTFGRARIELPLDTLHRGRVAVLASIYNLDGEFVIRAEMETIYDGDVREAARAYGYDRITWRDDRLPAD
jgi:uncharacterized protein involved in tellurium resistance